MKIYNAVVVFLTGLGVAYGQVSLNSTLRAPTDTSPISGEEWRLSLVTRLLSFPSPVTNGAIQLRGMGDEAAVDLLKILGGKNSLTVGESQAALDIIHMAFEQPDSIISPVNKTPQATTFLLQYLNSTSSDSTIQQRVIKETAFVRAAVVSSSVGLAVSKQ